METINLTDAEATELEMVLKTALSELHTEISHTDDRDFKARLKQQQETLQVVLLKLAAAEQAIGQAQLTGDLSREAAGHRQWAGALSLLGAYDAARA